MDVFRKTVVIFCVLFQFFFCVSPVTAQDDAGAVRDMGAAADAGLDTGLEAAAPVAAPPEGKAETPPAEKPDDADERTEERLNSIFSQVAELDDVRARMDSGVVHLSGKVLSAEGSKKAEELARSMDDVVYVDNQIDEVYEVGERVSPALAKLRNFFEGFVALIPLIGVGLLILLVFWFLSKWVVRLRFPFEKTTDRPLIRDIVRRAVQLGVFLIGVLIVLEIFNVTALVGAVLGTAGVAGLAIGFAFRDIAENYLASVMLSVYQPFCKNDIVELENGSGKVIRLTTRDTVLMTAAGNHLRIPNSAVFKSVITNYTRNPRRRFDFAVGVGTGENLTEVVREGVAVLEEFEGTLAEPAPFGLVEELGNWDVKLRFHGWVDQREHDFLATRSEAIRRMKDAFDQAGIEMPEETLRISTFDPMQKPPAPEHAPELADVESESVQVDTQIDSQIEEDRETSDERDLLG